MKYCKSIYCEVHYRRYITTPFVSPFVFENNIKFATIPKQKGVQPNGAPLSIFIWHKTLANLLQTFEN